MAANKGGKSPHCYSNVDLWTQVLMYFGGFKQQQKPQPHQGLPMWQTNTTCSNQTHVVFTAGGVQGNHSHHLADQPHANARCAPWCLACRRPGSDATTDTDWCSRMHACTHDPHTATAMSSCHKDKSLSRCFHGHSRDSHHARHAIYIYIYGQLARAGTRVAACTCQQYTDA